MMYRLLFLSFFIFMSVSLEAYSKRIILISFSTKERADSMMKELPALSPSLYTLAKKHNFEIKLKKSGKYYILIAEVFKDKKVLNTALKKIRKRFKGAYVSTYKYSSKKVPKVEKKVLKVEEKTTIKEILKQEVTFTAKKEVPKKEIAKDVVEVKVATPVEVPPVLIQKVVPEAIKIEPKIETIETKVKEILPKVSTEVLIKEVEKETIFDKILRIFQKNFEYSHIIILILAILVLRYYLKFKRIYDEY